MKIKIQRSNYVEEFEVFGYPNFMNHFVSFIIEGTYMEPIKTRVIPNVKIVEMEIINDTKN